MDASLLLERAGFTVAEIPKEWEAFWSFWCDTVQPAVRKAIGEDIYGVGLNMSTTANGDSGVEFRQFVEAYEANYVARDGQIIIDDATVRAGRCSQPRSPGWHCLPARWSSSEAFGSTGMPVEAGHARRERSEAAPCA